MSWEEIEPAQAGRAVDGDDARDHLAPAVRASKGEAHFGSPDKDPAVRLRVLEDAGRLDGPVHHRPADRHRRDPRPSGPSRSSRSAGSRGSTATSRRSSSRTSAPSRTPRCAHADDLGARGVPRRDRGRPARARPEGAACRRRRTWSTSTSARALLGAGIDDWGGVSPLTPDHVNPERPWPSLDGCARSPPTAGFDAARAADRPPASTSWPASPGSTRGSRAHVAALADDDGLAREGVRPTGPALAGAGRRLRRRVAAAPTCTPTIDTEGRTDDRRADFDDVYGDWDELRGRLAEVERVDPRSAATPVRSPSDYRRRRALRAGRGATPGNLTDEHALALLTAEGDAARAGAPRSPTTCAGRPSATTSPTSSTGTSTSPTSATPAAGSARSPSGAPTPTPTRSRSTRSPTGPRRRGSSARPRSACRAASTPTCPARRTSTSPPR